MTDDRSRRFESDLAAVLRETAGSGAPASLRYRLAGITARPQAVQKAWLAPWLGWAAAAAAVVALALLGMFLVPNANVPSSSKQPPATVPHTGEPTPSGDASPTPPSAAPSPVHTPSALPSPTSTRSVSPSPARTPAPVATAWSSLAWSPGVATADGQIVNDLVPWHDGYVGVGGIAGGSGFDIGFYASKDGVHWRLASRKATAQRNVMAGRVVSLGNRLLAVGEAVMNAPGEKPDFAPYLWVSNDGRTWTQLHSASWDAALLGKGVSRLIAGPDGILAVTLGADPAVLHSIDGTEWTRATLPATERAIVEDAIAYAGGFAIVGRDGQPDRFSEAVINEQSPPGVGHPAAWISADGVHWSAATVTGDRVAGAELDHVVAVDSGLLALGIANTADFYDAKLTSWTTVDGRTWSIAADAGWPLAANSIPTLAGDGTQAVVLGWAPEGGTLAAWVSTDGVRWTRVTFAPTRNAPPVDCGSHPDCVRTDQAWVVPDGVIVVGNSIAGGGSQRFWLATPGS